MMMARAFLIAALLYDRRQEEISLDEVERIAI